ncbi:hypothetical protein E4U11_005297 [Claviceps purpurea]|nr:hypothetical protein E4U37_001972 [Claviceps purpurea]KAG6168747.1 hypothetical protein E4U11_005297 [Claviceps purpurea]
MQHKIPDSAASSTDFSVMGSHGLKGQNIPSFVNSRDENHGPLRKVRGQDEPMRKYRPAEPSKWG